MSHMLVLRLLAFCFRLKNRQTKTPTHMSLPAHMVKDNHHVAGKDMVVIVHHGGYRSPCRIFRVTWGRCHRFELSTVV
jgi:hypothetical protein